jgi:hypothetical protein
MFAENRITIEHRLDDGRVLIHVQDWGPALTYEKTCVESWARVGVRYEKWRRLTEEAAIA